MGDYSLYNWEKSYQFLKIKILRKICGPVFDVELNIWRRRKNTELREEITEVSLSTSYIKCQTPVVRSDSSAEHIKRLKHQNTCAEPLADLFTDGDVIYT